MKPILFNTEMIRAIQNDTKTVTRRVLKPQPEITPIPTFGGSYRISMKGNVFVKPSYRPGEIMYVRETFKIDYLSNILGSGRIHYKADDTYRDFTFSPERYEMMRRAQLKPGWRPNENMPREAARIFLRVTDVRVERLQEITPEQIDAEGCKEYGYSVETGELMPSSPCYFSIVWNNTIKKADYALYSWDVNPWVWVIEFERCERLEGE